MLAALLGQPPSSRALCRLLLPGSGLVVMLNSTPTALPLLISQVKRRETEQQAEARLRSYAHLAAQEEADQWVPLEFHGETSGALFLSVHPASQCVSAELVQAVWRASLTSAEAAGSTAFVTHRTPPLAAAAAAELAQKVWNRLASAEQAQDVPLTLTRQQYLDAIVPGTRAGPGGGGPGAVVLCAAVVPMVACHSLCRVLSLSSCAAPSSRPVCLDHQTVHCAPHCILSPHRIQRAAQLRDGHVGSGRHGCTRHGAPVSGSGSQERRAQQQRAAA